MATVGRWAKAEGRQESLRAPDAEVARTSANCYGRRRGKETGGDLAIVRRAALRLAKNVAQGKVKGRPPELPRLSQLKKEPLAEPDSPGDPDGSGYPGPVFVPQDNGSYPLPEPPTPARPDRK